MLGGRIRHNSARHAPELLTDAKVSPAVSQIKKLIAAGK
jgi:hypothetical protein